MKKMFFAALAVAGLSASFSTAPVLAEEGLHKTPPHAAGVHDKARHDTADKADEVQLSPGDARIHVNGMVCDFCARALEKVFGKEEAVKDIHVSLDDKVVSVRFNEGHSLDDEALTKMITDSGYTVEEIERVE